jgi:hypothetical protein
MKLTKWSHLIYFRFQRLSTQIRSQVTFAMKTDGGNYKNGYTALSTLLDRHRRARTLDVFTLGIHALDWMCILGMVSRR